MEPLSTRNAGSLYGLYYGAFFVVFSFLLNSTKLEGNLLLNLTGWGIFIAVMAMAMRKFKEDNEGYMNYSQGRGIGFYYSLVAGIISGLFDTFYLTVVNPTMLQDKLDESIAFYESESNMTDEQIEAMAEMSESFTHPVILFTIALAGALIIGVTISLIVAAVMKKDNLELDLEEE